MNRIERKARFPKSSRLNIVVALGILLTTALSSCTPTKNSYYFKTLPNDTNIPGTMAKGPELQIKKNDVLSIVVSSLNPAEDAVYNSAAGVSGNIGVISGTNPTGSGYVVDANGNIQFHRLGIIHAEGMTRRELKNKIQRDILPYLKDPIVNVLFVNHNVTVFGEVGKSQVLSMPEEQLSIIDVIATSGDLSMSARKDNILIIRETSNGKQFKRVNMENHSIFTSEWYYLQPGDVVYVEPNDKRVNEENRNRRQQTLSVVVTSVSFALLILDRIFRN